MNKSKTSLFLMELIISILFFSLASAVCIQLFVRSHLLSNQTINMNHAVMNGENMAELFLGCDGDFDQILTTFGKTEAFEQIDEFTIRNEDDLLCIYFDADWKLIPSKADMDQAAFTLFLHSTEDEVYSYADISVFTEVVENINKASPIYTLQVKKYHQKGSDF